MIRNISIGIDLGSATTKVVVGELLKGEKYPKVIGMGESTTAGMRHGYITHMNDAVESVRRAVAQAETTSGIKIRRATLSVGGTSVRGEMGVGVAIVSKADGEVTHLDISKALEEAEDSMALGNRRVLHSYPISHKLDGKEVSGRVEGMRGTKLETRALFITCSSQHLEDLMAAVSLAGVEPIDLVASPIAGSNLALSTKQKIAGSALVNIGSETVSLITFENEMPTSVRTFSIGGDDVTNDIALGLKIPLEKAEALKLDPNTTEYPKKKLDEIIDARLSDIFELIENHLKKIKRSGLLPAGVMFIGGGANTVGLEELSRSMLSLPSAIGSTDMFGISKTRLRDSAYMQVLGLLISSKNDSVYASGFMGVWSKTVNDAKKLIKSGLKQLMP